MPQPEIVVPRRLRELSVAEQGLFERCLAGRQAVVEALLLRLRQQVDEELAPRLPRFAGKAYPLGRCREIRDAVFARLSRLLSDPAAPRRDPGLAALADYLRAGGTCHKIWGALRERYFQNALQLGGWYVDVSNDTVDPTKPKIEILPLAESGFSNVRDYRHFCGIAAVYWEVDIYANSVFPRLAPLLPLICVRKEGSVWLAAAYDEIIELTRSDAFRPSESILAELPPPPGALRERLRAKAAGLRSPWLSAEGDALEACRKARAEGLMHSARYRQEGVEAWLQLRDAKA